MVGGWAVIETPSFHSNAALPQPLNRFLMFFFFVICTFDCDKIGGISNLDFFIRHEEEVKSPMVERTIQQFENIVQNNNIVQYNRLAKIAFG